MQIWRAGKGRPVTFALLAAFTALLSFPGLQPFNSVRLALFDEYQNLSSRTPLSQPVVIVEIDDPTLNVLGQWPWPRNYFAALIDSIAALNPAAVGLDIIMPEPDHASPQAVAESRPDLPEGVRNILTGAASNDRLLAASLAGVPTVLSAVGFPYRMPSTQDALQHAGIIKVQGGNPQPWLNSYHYVLASLPEFQAAAKGQALINGDPENGIIRRAALLSNLNGKITPGLALEMLRVAQGLPDIVVVAGEHGVEAVRIGSRRIPLQENGEAWLHFDKPSRLRYVSALDLLKNRVPASRIRGKMVLIGLTGMGLQDLISTPLGDRRPGVEVHAQLIESFEDHHFLIRPWWMHWVELAALAGGGSLLIWTLPGALLRSEKRRTKRHAALHQGSEQRGRVSRERREQRRASGINLRLAAMLFILLATILFGTGIALFHYAGLLFDAASLFIAFSIILGSLLLSVFVESGHQQKRTELALQNQHVKAAKIAGELERLRRFFSPAVADQLLSVSSDELYRPHRREIVVLFLDLRGYTAFTQKHGADEVMRILGEFHAAMGELISIYDATLERFAGDGIMIFFNDPLEIPDPAAKAASMALQMQERFNDLNRIWEQRGYSLALGIGIAQGIATIGAIGFEGRRDYAAIGSVTNLAARLCGEARGGQILASSVVAENIGEAARIHAVGDLVLKGFSEPVVCFEILPAEDHRAET
jgi:CHASE2 domain-containing sensor protein/class 3 adenylate cyclase